MLSWRGWRYSGKRLRGAQQAAYGVGAAHRGTNLWSAAEAMRNNMDAAKYSGIRSIAVFRSSEKGGGMSELKTCFKRVDYDLAGLLHYLDIGDIGLPDIQRPFVWSNAKVRDLFDSMYRGFPVGYFLFWENAQTNGDKQIGIGKKQHTVASRLIVDGQQRLTSLYAVFRGKKVLDDDYRERQIEIAFRPRDGRFDVADVAIRRDPEWIANISELWVSGKSSYQMVKGFLN